MLSAWLGAADAIWSTETTRFNLGAWRCPSVANRGGRAAAQPDATCRCDHESGGGRPGRESASHGIRARAATTGLDRRSQRTPAGPGPMPLTFADTWPNWLRSLQRP